MKKLRVVLWKPSGYKPDGDFVTRFRRGFMPNATIRHIEALTPETLGDAKIELHTVDEYVEPDLSALELLKRPEHTTNLVAFIGTQSHQFPHAADLAAMAVRNGSLAIIGGPHTISCDTSMLHNNRGLLSFALAEAELVWHSILEDATHGGVKTCYGGERRWTEELPTTLLKPPNKRDLRRSLMPMVGQYPMRGCAEDCSFCAIPGIAGKRERGQAIDTIIAGLKAAKAAGVRRVMFTSDNFNQWSKARDLMQAMVDEKIGLSFFIQCTTKLAREKDEAFWELAARAGCSQIFFGIESIDREILKAEHKRQNDPVMYPILVQRGRRYGIAVHFSNIIGFPGQTRAGVLEHLEAIKQLDPDHVSWYILTFVPGTEDYAQALNNGIKLDPDLSHYDCNRPVWQHPNFAKGELEELMFRCYRECYSLSRVIRHGLERGRNRTRALFQHLTSAAFNRYSAATGRHPMSGGIWQRYLDRESDYARYRYLIFGIKGHFELPKNRVLSAVDTAMNRLLNPASIAAARSLQPLKA